MPHDFINFPELANSQMALYYFESPHKQITEDIRATVIKVHDGDTLTVRVNFRDFDFPVRFLNTDAPELNEDGGHESRDWLESRILGEEIDILIDPDQRVGKWGRLLGTIFHRGMSLNDESIRAGMSVPFDNRNEGEIPNWNKEMKKHGLRNA